MLQTVPDVILERAPQVSCAPMVFVFLDPWTLGTGRLPGMLHSMLERGFSLLDFEYKSLSEADAEEIYRTNHPIREANSWHVARLVYPMGRSIGLLLGVTGEDPCACARMKEMKGKANPSANRAGQLRYDFFAPNRCLSLMHSSDDLDQVKREAPVFFSSERLDKAGNEARLRQARPKRASECISMSRGELGLERIEEPGLGALFARVRLRLLERLRRCCHQLPGREALSGYGALWTPLSQQGGRKPVVAEATEYLATVRQEEPFLDALAALVGGGNGHYTSCFSEFYRPSAGEPLSILHCLQILNNPPLYSRWDSDRQLPPDLFYDRWERLLFITHLFNFDDMLFAIR